MTRGGENFHPAIVVMAYERPDGLQRLLRQLQSARYPGDMPITLVISIDRSNDPALRQAVRDTAERFEWSQGEKIVNLRSQRIGLKAHVLSCTDLALEYGSVIVLEDDLGVSPVYYRWALETARFSAEYPEIAGVALYSPAINESNKLRFEPIDDGSDNFYLQRTCSWGQLFTAEQWRAFKAWLEKNPAVQDDACLPEDILAWPDSSWKKHHLAYLCDTGRTVLYPRRSLTTNFGDAGEHFSRDTSLHRVPMPWDGAEPSLMGPEKALAVYDVFFEIRPESLRRLQPALEELDFVVDLAGGRRLRPGQAEYVLTARPTRSSVRSWGCQLRPPELNIALDEPGTGLVLARFADIDVASDAAIQNALFEQFHDRFTFRLGFRFMMRKAWIGLKRWVRPHRRMKG